jgi:hypothetical protein
MLLLLGFTPDVKIWDICFDKTGNFKEVAHACELKGHSAGVYSFAFSDGSSRLVLAICNYFHKSSP